MHNATITLHGHWQSAQLPIFGIKLIGLTQGKIFMHGQPKTSYANLGATAVAGSNTITLASTPAGWAPGDALAVISAKPNINCTSKLCRIRADRAANTLRRVRLRASRRAPCGACTPRQRHCFRGGCSGSQLKNTTRSIPLVAVLRNDACETEEIELLGVDGATLTLAAPLRYEHLVETHAVDGRTITLTTEVINLNRNVRIRGSDGPGTAGFGGHVMLLQPTDGCPCQISTGPLPDFDRARR